MLKLLHERLDLITDFIDVGADLVILGLLLLCLLDNGADARLQLPLELCLNHAHLSLVRCHLFLVCFLVFAIFSDLVLDLLPDLLIPLHLLSACLLKIVDLLGDLLHALLEVFGQIGALLPFFIKHLLVLQVQVMILFEN